MISTYNFIYDDNTIVIEMGSMELAVRINGVLPDVAAGPGEANTSVSIYSGDFHLLVDAGGGVSASLKAGQLGRPMPDAILITHAENEHISDLPALVSQSNVRIFCTTDCMNQVISKLPSLADKQAMFTAVQPGQTFEAGPFSVTPVAAENSGDEPGFPGSVIYVIRIGDRKVIAGWDFLTLLNADQNLMWNPDLLLLGTETYNEHPSTGIISVSEAYDIVRRWNAKDCYVLHYSGEKDTEDKRNQWHRGPVGPLSPDELQKVINDHLLVTGHEGKFAITVARQGMVWTPAAKVEEEGPVGKKIEIEALEKYVFSLEKLSDGKVALSIEDSVNRLTSEFINPRLGGDGKSLNTDAVKSMMMKGPELHLGVSESSVRLDVLKGKKPMFAKDIPVSEQDARKLVRYLQENFTA